MRQTAHNPERIGICDQRAFPGETPLDVLDGIVGQVGEIADGLMLDLAVFAVGSAQEHGLVGLALVGLRHSLDMNFSWLLFAHSRLVAKTISSAWP